MQLQEIRQRDLVNLSHISPKVVPCITIVQYGADTETQRRRPWEDQAEAGVMLPEAKEAVAT